MLKNKNNSSTTECSELFTYQQISFQQSDLSMLNRKNVAYLINKIHQLEQILSTTIYESSKLKYQHCKLQNQLEMKTNQLSANIQEDENQIEVQNSRVDVQNQFVKQCNFKNLCLKQNEVRTRPKRRFFHSTIQSPGRYSPFHDYDKINNQRISEFSQNQSAFCPNHTGMIKKQKKNNIFQHRPYTSTLVTLGNTDRQITKNGYISIQNIWNDPLSKKPKNNPQSFLYYPPR